MTNQTSIRFQRLGAIALLGFTASIGFALSGMANSDHVRHFFDLKRLSSNTWDPSLLFTFIAALGSHFVLYQRIITKKAKPLFGTEFMIPKLTQVDQKLMLGAFIFGIGWAIGGFCPGPAITAAFAGQHEAAVFLCFLYVGFMLSYYTQNGIKNITSLGLASMAILAIILIANLTNFSHWSGSSGKNEFNENPWIGGLIIGTSAFGMMFFVGRIFGISGLSSGLVLPSPSLIENWMFFIGMLIGSYVIKSWMPSVVIARDVISMRQVVTSGLLVGVGTNLGSGCTSGHGICGISRMSKRSITATLIFFLTNIIVSTLFL